MSECSVLRSSLLRLLALAGLAAKIIINTLHFFFWLLKRKKKSSRLLVDKKARTMRKTVSVLITGGR